MAFASGWMPDDFLLRPENAPPNNKASLLRCVIRGLLARAVFCAKECAFKCQFPVSQTMLNFEDLTVSIDLDCETFIAIFRRDTPAFPHGALLRGRVRISDA